jgi:low temperature requirement protein LtrA
MKKGFRSQPVRTDETHRATSFEVFFDLVFIFAITRVITFIGRPPTPLSLIRGLIVVLLLWMAWTTYTWLSNQVRADVGLIPAGTLVAMAAIFVAALVIPDAWRHGDGVVDAPLALALAYVVIRLLDLVLYFHVAGGDRQMRTTLRLFTTTTVLAWIPLMIGAILNGTAQTGLWAGAFLLDFGGGFLASSFSGWRLRSPSHFTERHGLVLIIALGESLLSAGIGAGVAVTRGPVLVAALLGFTVTACLWWLYFKNSAAAAGRALGRAPSERRGQPASNGYSLGHFPLIAGVIYTALGIEQVLSHLARDRPPVTVMPSLEWTSTVALYGGVILYLAGRALFLRLTVRIVPRTQIIAIAVALLLLPAAGLLPPLAALALLAAFLCTLVGYEWLSQGEQEPATGRT